MVLLRVTGEDSENASYTAASQGRERPDPAPGTHSECSFQGKFWHGAGSVPPRAPGGSCQQAGYGGPQPCQPGPGGPLLSITSGHTGLLTFLQAQRALSPARTSASDSWGHWNQAAQAGSEQLPWILSQIWGLQAWNQGGGRVGWC